MSYSTLGRAFGGALLGATALALTLVSSQAGGGGKKNPPPFDFTDAFYLKNGINPAKILDRVNGTCPANDMPSCSVVDKSNTDPNRRNIRVLSTTGGWDIDGKPLYYNIFGMVNPDTFTNDAAGKKAMDIANNFEAYIFPKADGDPLSPALSNRRQDNVFATTPDYFTGGNPLGLWIAVFVQYTIPDKLTKEQRKALHDLAKKNGRDLDGTPQIHTPDELDFLEGLGLAAEQTRPVDGSKGFPWIL